MDISSILQNNQFFTGAAGAGIVLGALSYLRSYPVRIKDFFVGRYTTSLTVHSGEMASFASMEMWLRKQKADTWKRNYRITESYKGKYRDLDIGKRPHYGSYWFWWNKKLCHLTSWKEEGQTGGGQDKKTREFMSVHFFSSDKNISDTFLVALKKEQENNKDKEYPSIRAMASIPHYSDDGGLELRTEEMGVPILKEGQLEYIQNDLEQFDKREAWYNHRGIPYRRGYAFYGPPGTGKTTLIRYLAATTNRDIYFVGYNDLIGAGFAKSLPKVPKRSFVVIEDLDRIFASAAIDDKKKETEIDDGKVKSQRSLIDIAGFLNSLDGIASPHGLIFIFTANDLSVLDPAVLRPGRVDVRLLLNQVDIHQANKLHERFYDEPSQQFAVVASDLKLTPAQCQEILLRAGSKDNVMNELKELN